jgi:predicted nucleic acid-binding protein
VIIFLDANVIIYQVEGSVNFHNRVLNTVQDLLQKHPRARFAVSRLSVLECLVKPVREGSTDIIDRYRTFFAAGGLQVVEVSGQVIEKALLLRAHQGLRTPDAIQAASALSMNGPVVFLTGDKAFGKVAGLSVRVIE